MSDVIEKRVGTIEELQGLDRRKSERVDYSARQRVAFGKFSTIPPMACLVSVDCRDLSRGGFSFHSADQAEALDLVVELKRPTGTIYIQALVASCKICSDPGKPAWVIGCRFIKRIWA